MSLMLYIVYLGKELFVQIKKKRHVAMFIIIYLWDGRVDRKQTFFERRSHSTFVSLVFWFFWEHLNSDIQDFSPGCVCKPCTISLP